MLLEYIKKYEKSSIITSILMITMSVLLILKPETMLNTIITILGTIVLVEGIIRIILYFFTGKETRVFSSALIEGTLSIIVAALILSNKEFMISVLPVVVGIWIIVKSIIKLQLSFNMKSADENAWIFIFISSIITLILGIIAITSPFEVMVTITVLSGIMLLITGIIDVIESICIIRKLK